MRLGGCFLASWGASSTNAPDAKRRAAADSPAVFSYSEPQQSHYRHLQYRCVFLFFLRDFVEQWGAGAPEEHTFKRGRRPRLGEREAGRSPRCGFKSFTQVFPSRFSPDRASLWARLITRGVLIKRTHNMLRGRGPQLWKGDIYSRHCRKQIFSPFPM